MLVFDKYLCSFLVFSHLVIADSFFFFPKKKVFLFVFRTNGEELFALSTVSPLLCVA